MQNVVCNVIQCTITCGGLPSKVAIILWIQYFLCKNFAEDLIKRRTKSTAINIMPVASRAVYWLDKVNLVTGSVSFKEAPIKDARYAHMFDILNI